MTSAGADAGGAGGSWRGPLINFGHALDHLIMLIFPTAVLAMAPEFGMSYAEMLPLSLGGFIAFGAMSLPAGWLGDRWSRDRMMAVFFIGAGVACLLTSLARDPLQIAIGLTLIGTFAAIYHPIAAPLLVANEVGKGRRLGVNGFFGNFGVAVAALLTGALIDHASWRAAFAAPGVACLAGGVLYLAFVPNQPRLGGAYKPFSFGLGAGQTRRLLLALGATTMIGGLIFSVTTIVMPKLFSERLTMAGGATEIGLVVFAVFFFAGFAQMIVGPLADRFSPRTILIGVVAMQAPFLAAAALAEGWLLAAVSLGMMLAVFGQIPINDVMIAAYVSDEYRARAYALRYLASLGSSAVAVQMTAWAYGWTGGFTELFVSLAVLSAAMFVAVFAFPARTDDSASKRPSEKALAPAE